MSHRRQNNNLTRARKYLENVKSRRFRVLPLVRVFSNSEKEFVYRGDKSVNFSPRALRDSLYNKRLCSTKCDKP